MLVFNLLEKTNNNINRLLENKENTTLLSKNN